MFSFSRMYTHGKYTWEVHMGSAHGKYTWEMHMGSTHGKYTWEPSTQDIGYVYTRYFLQVTTRQETNNKQ